MEPGRDSSSADMRTHLQVFKNHSIHSAAVARRSGLTVLLLLLSTVVQAQTWRVAQAELSSLKDTRVG